jgi:hypothetical protein
VLWSAGIETGDLREWDDQTNSGSASSAAVTAFSAGIAAKSGSWVMRQSVTGSAGGTRMARFSEVDALTKAGTAFYWSWWDYYPTKVSFPLGDMLSIFQIASQDSAGGFHPIWTLNFHPSNFTLTLMWSPNAKAPAEGPHAGEFEARRTYSSTPAVPVGQWVFFEVMVKPAADFTGALKVWMNGQVLFDQTNIKTRFPDEGAGGFMWLNNNAYGSNLTPTPFHHYVDDVTLSLSRMPYSP